MGLLIFGSELDETRAERAVGGRLGGLDVPV